uniref:Selenoprotein T n=1 Tax=Strigamia maritima TaxID=126957 RepID=T1J566_STRMM
MADLPRPVYMFVFFVFFGLTIKDLINPSERECRTKISQQQILINSLGQHSNFFTGYRKVFEQYASLIQDKYPNIIISGDNFPPPTHRLQLAQILGIGKLILIVLIVSSVNPFDFMGADTPSVYRWFLNNKLYSCMMIYFLSNVLESQLISTGAFEIAFKDVPVWSKLETGRIPSPPELFQIIENENAFN